MGSRVFVLLAIVGRRKILQHLGTNEQNQHFVELRQKSMIVVLQTGLPSLNGKLERL